MVKRRPLHIGILMNLILHVTILVFFKMLNYVDYLLSHWKEEFKLGIRHCQLNQFIVEKQFMEVFLDAHDNYDYDELCVELNKK
jgi:hypothetical protein